MARVSDFGKNDTIFNIPTHLGHYLNPGDYALGYDLYAANSNDMELEKYRYFVLPDAILIKKIYVENCQRKGGKPPELSLPATSSGGHFICSSSPSIFFLGSASSPAVSTGSDLSTEQETAAIVRHSPARTQAVGHLHHGSVEATLQRPLTPRSCRSHYDDLKRRFQRIVGGDGGGAVVSFLFSFYALLRIGLASSFLMPLLCGSCIFFSDSIPHVENNHRSQLQKIKIQFTNCLEILRERRIVSSSAIASDDALNRRLKSS